MAVARTIFRENEAKLDRTFGVVEDLAAEIWTQRKISDLEEAGLTEEAKKERDALAKMSFREWSKLIPEPKFGILDFSHFPYQKEMYDWSPDDPEGVVQKAAQVGMSAWMIRWAMYFPDTRGRTALYVFPADEQGRKFSNTRIKPLIQQSKWLRDRVSRQEVNNVHERRIGQGYFHLTGSQSQASLESIDADVLALDEYDYLVQAHIPFAEKRIEGPLSLGYIRRIGFPTLPNYGINKKFLASDQREWRVKCSGCNEWQTIDFWENVDQATAKRVCKKCLKPLNVAKGQWVANYPERDTRGYLVTRLIVPNAKIDRVIAESKLRTPYEIQNFHNRTLGQPYAAKEGRLSLEAIQAAQNRGGGYTQGPRDLGYRGDNIVSMGIDVASVRELHVRISEHITDHEKRALFIGTVDGFNDLPFLMEAYGVHMAGIDHLPEGRLARSFAERFAGRVYLVSFATQGQKDVLAVEEDQRRASVRRTEAMDATINMIRTQRNLLPLDIPESYVEHMQAPVRFFEKDEMDKVTVGYRSTGPDDFFMAETYDIIAAELFWLRVLVDDASREQISTLDDLAEFERSDLGRPGEGEYRPGRDDYYSPGR